MGMATSAVYVVIPCFFKFIFLLYISLFFSLSLSFPVSCFFSLFSFLFSLFLVFVVTDFLRRPGGGSTPGCVAHLSAPTASCSPSCASPSPPPPPEQRLPPAAPPPPPPPPPFPLSKT